jgi:hypothetical protein
MSVSGGESTPTYPVSSRVTVSPVPAVTDEWHTYLFNRASWGAIIAGVVAALVVQLLLNVLGIGVGAASFNVTPTPENPAVGSFSIAAGIWWTVSGIIGSFCGGVVAGRLCGAAKASTARWHGFVAWCVTTLVIFYLLTTTLGAIVGGTFNVLGSTLGGVGRTAAAAAAGLGGNTQPGGGLEAQVRSLVNPNDTQAAQNDILTYLRARVAGNEQAANAARDRAVNALARVANISPDEARNRLSQAEQQARQTLDQAAQMARQAAEVTRVNAARAGIFGFIALVIGAIVAWLGGGLGTPRRETEAVAVAARPV